MGMSGRLVSGCAALLLALTSVSAVQKLGSINDLKKINFGQSVPKHTLLLLHWFANVVDINNNNVILLTFDPDNDDYGSHHYGNYEQLLDPVPRGYQYYTVGNLNTNGHDELPDHIIYPQAEYEGRNMDRIIFRVRQQNTGGSRQTDQVYITQHYETFEHQGTRYDPEHTYQVTNRLLRQIREFSEGGNLDMLQGLRNRFRSNASDSQLRQLRNTWGSLACLGLLLFIVIQEKHSCNQPKKIAQPPARRNTQPEFVVNIPESRYQNPPRQNPIPRYRQEQRDETLLLVTTGKNGKARILWRNVSRDRLNNGVMIVLFKNNRDQEASSTYKSIGDSESGCWDTSVPLNEGLQARLHKVRVRWCFWKVVGEEICRGPEFKYHSEVDIIGFSAKLQLFVKDGKACARLFIRKNFGDWRLKFSDAWVGFYTSADKHTNQYAWRQWQRASKFQPSTDVEHYVYDVYEYCSGMTIATGVQARFIDWAKEVRAQTPSWGY